MINRLKTGTMIPSTTKLIKGPHVNSMIDRQAGPLVLKEDAKARNNESGYLTSRTIPSNAPLSRRHERLTGEMKRKVNATRDYHPCHELDTRMLVKSWRQEISISHDAFRDEKTGHVAEGIMQKARRQGLSSNSSGFVFTCGDCHESFKPNHVMIGTGLPSKVAWSGGWLPWCSGMSRKGGLRRDAGLENLVSACLPVDVVVLRLDGRRQARRDDGARYIRCYARSQGGFRPPRFRELERHRCCSSPPEMFAQSRSFVRQCSEVHCTIQVSFSAEAW